MSRRSRVGPCAAGSYWERRHTAAASIRRPGPLGSDTTAFPPVFPISLHFLHQTLYFPLLPAGSRPEHHPRRRLVSPIPTRRLSPSTPPPPATTMPPKKAATGMKKPRSGAEGEAGEHVRRGLGKRAGPARRCHRAIQRQADAEAAQAACFASYAASHGTSTGDSSPVAARSGTDGSMLFLPRLPRPACLWSSGRSRHTRAPATAAWACSRR
jgi:hypothetical protein